MKTLAAIFLLSAAAFAQGGVYAGPTVVNGVGQPIANASVYIVTGNPCGTAPTYIYCNGLAQGIYSGTVPPSPLASVYKDITLGTAIPNPIVTDPLGNWTVYASPGVYWALITGYQIVPQVQPIAVGNGQGGGGSVNCPTALNGSMAAFISPTSLGCDQNAGTDFLGNVFGQSFSALGPVNGFVSLIGGGVAPGTQIKFKLPANAFRWLAPTTVGTPYYAIPPATRCAVGQTWILASETTDANGDKVDTYQCGNVGAAGVEAQTNGVDNSNCTAGVCPLLNNATGTASVGGVQVTPNNSSGGTTVYNATDTATRANNPIIPVATVNGTPGTTDYKYLVVGCESVDCTWHSAPSPVVDVATGAATITSVNSITLSGYGDTLYGYRFFLVCRTASSGTPGTTGIIASGVGKAFIDTGFAGDGTNCASTYATNTTVLRDICRGSFSPGGNSVPGAPCGIDAPPLVPKADDNEGGAQFGAPADANDGVFAWINQSSATATWTGGTINFNGATHGGSNVLSCLEVVTVLPTAPYTYVALLYPNWDVATGSHDEKIEFGFYESATQKAQAVGIFSSASNNQFIVEGWATPTTGEVFTKSSDNNFSPYNNPLYVQVANDATHLTYSVSSDGLKYKQLYQSAALNTFFTTAPNHLVACTNGTTGAPSFELDYIRRTQ